MTAETFYCTVVHSVTDFSELCLDTESSRLFFNTVLQHRVFNCSIKVASKLLLQTDLHCKFESSCSLSSLFKIPKLNPATFDPLDKLQTSLCSKSWSSSEFVFLTAVSTAVLAVRPLSWLQYDSPCRSNFGTPAGDGLARIFWKVLHVRVSTARPWHCPQSDFLPFTAPKPDCPSVSTRVFASR